MKLAICLIAVIFLFFPKSASAAISFTISNPVQQGEEVSFDVSLSGLTSNSCNEGSCYLQAAFTFPSPIRYFGFTKNHGGELYEYISKPSITYIQSTFFTFQPIDGAWSGQLSLKINFESPYYKGSGEYNIKAWRYSGKTSNGPSGEADNTLTISIEESPTPTPTPTPTSTPTPTPTQKTTSTPTKTPTSTTTPKPTLPSKDYSKSIVTIADNATKPNVSEASVAAAKFETSPSAQQNVEVKSEKGINYLVIIGAILALGGIGSIFLIYLRSKWST